MIFVVDITDDIKSIYGGIKFKSTGMSNKKLSYRNSIDETRILIHKLMAEDEMRMVHTLVIIFNVRKGTEIYEKIFESDTKTSTYLKKLEA